MDERHPAVAAAPSSIAGDGLFAAEPVSAGSTVLRLAEPDFVAAGFGGLNHSCDPNLCWAGDRTLVALNDIPTGTELTVDYTTAVTDSGFVMYCHCGTYRCRQVIEGSDWRIPQLQLRYAGRWHPAVHRLIEAQHP